MSVADPLDLPTQVYVATNKINGKRYIGITHRKLWRRQYEHVRDALLGGRTVFSRAIRKYGADGFEWQIVAQFPTGREALEEEKRLIRTTRPEYNATLGGEAYRPRVLSAEVRERIAAVHRGNTYRLGKTHTQTTRERLREVGLRDRSKWLERSHLGPATLAKPVVCLDDGRRYDSAAAAARAYGVATNCVSEVCSRSSSRSVAGGLVFRYVGDHHDGTAEATRERNKARSNSSSGYKGISPYRTLSGLRWRAQVATGGRKKKRKIHLGLFDTPEEAHAAYLKARSEMV